MQNCIIVDDQVHNIEVIEEHIKKIPQLKILKTFTKSHEALDFLQNNCVDIAFLDIRMPHITGMEIIETLKTTRSENLPAFILTTGYKEYAIPAFDIGVTDYLIKPIGFKRFKIALDRVKPSTSNVIQLSEKDYVFIESDNEKIKLQHEDIAYIESSGNYVDIVGPIIRKMTIYKTLNYIENLLPTNKFIRVHKSYIVSINYIHKMKQNEFALKNVIEGQRTSIPLGPKYKESIMKLLGFQDT
jgi:DNA-binding LytR/AlgR family response regulator